MAETTPSRRPILVPFSMMYPVPVASSTKARGPGVGHDDGHQFQLGQLHALQRRQVLGRNLFGAGGSLDDDVQGKERIHGALGVEGVFRQASLLPGSEFVHGQPLSLFLSRGVSIGFGFGFRRGLFPLRDFFLGLGRKLGTLVRGLGAEKNPR